jgi:hypothetical protein
VPTWIYFNAFSYDVAMLKRLSLAGVTVALMALATSVDVVGQGARSSQPSYARDIAPILHASCITCHRPGEVAPMSLRSFDEVRPWARSIKQKVVAREMPPWFADASQGVFANDPRLTPQQIDTITRWVDAGALRGNVADEKPAPALVEGWQLGEPDHIITLPTVQIPAEGKDYFPTPNLTLDIPDDRWIRAVEIRPSNREVTHHSVIFTTGGVGAGAFAGGFLNVLGVWAVGTPPMVYPEGMGRRLRKGQQLRTNLHYHPNGKPATDTTRIGLYWGTGEMKKEVTAAVAGNITFEIPPGEKDHELRAVYIVDQDSTVVSYFPHMHFRGKTMSMTATYPDGRKRTLINVPKYDFNWQLFYYPKERLSLPRGTRIDVVARYDNSADNPFNPDPTKRVRFGEASDAEMMFGMFEFVANEGVSPTPASPQTKMDALRSTLPADDAYNVPLALGRFGMPTVVHLPRKGPATWYLPANPQIVVAQIRDVVWNGDQFTFAVDIRIGPNADWSFAAKGEKRADGTIRGDVTSLRETPVPIKTFESTPR